MPILKIQGGSEKIGINWVAPPPPNYVFQGSTNKLYINKLNIKLDLLTFFNEWNKNMTEK